MLSKVISFFILFYSLTLGQVLGPTVSVPGIEYDFGNVQPGSTLSHRFVLYNGGDGTLKLYVLRTSCRCVSAILDRYEVSPSDSANLQVTFNPSKELGDHLEFIYIKTNDTNNPELKLQVKATVLKTENQLFTTNAPFTKVSGPRTDFPVKEHDFGKIKQGSVVDYTFKFYNKGDASLKIKDLYTSCGCTAAVVKKKILEPGQEGQLRVEFDSAGRSGRGMRQVTVKTNDPVNPTTLLKIYADITAGK